jgi:hypothetical protein
MKTRARSLVSIAGAAMISALAVLAFSCGRYSNADVQGYVKDAGTGIGILGATVDVYLTDPSAGGATPFVSTSTSYNLQIPGWYAQRIMWYSDNPMFDDEGDMRGIWLVVSHPDFAASPPVSVPGVVSGTTNTVPDVLLTREYFTAMTVTGMVINASGAGINGTKVGLELDGTDTTENDDYIAYTTTYVPEGGTPVPGTFTFLNVRWQKTDSASAVSDVKEVKLWVTPPAGYSPTSAVVDINSGQIPNVLSPVLVN